MIMSINKNINDKNNSKLKTLEIINYEVNQSKMMFLFIFVLFKQYSSSTSLNFISSIFDDEYYSLAFLLFLLNNILIFFKKPLNFLLGCVIIKKEYNAVMQKSGFVL